jgi:hypothetical protein
MGMEFGKVLPDDNEDLAALRNQIDSLHDEFQRLAAICHDRGFAMVFTVFCKQLRPGVIVVDAQIWPSEVSPEFRRSIIKLLESKWGKRPS